MEATFAVAGLISESLVKRGKLSERVTVWFGLFPISTPPNGLYRLAIYCSVGNDIARRTFTRYIPTQGDDAMKVEIEREDDGRWIAEVPDIPGVMAYGKTRQDAVAKAEALALRIIADRIDHGEAIPELDDLFAVPA